MAEDDIYGSKRKYEEFKSQLDSLLIELRLIRFRGHLPKGGYDVHNGRDEAPAFPPAV